MKPAGEMAPRRSGLLGLLGLSSANRRVLAEALVTLVLVSLAIRLMPFRKLVGIATRPADGEPGEREGVAIARCRWAIERWAEKLPWKTMCFQKGLSLHIMLRRRGIESVLHYGVMQNAERGLTAHVWISEGERILMGGETAGDYTPLARYPAASGKSG